eukprot:5015013-Pyramimonas_sp.AAC.1
MPAVWWPLPSGLQVVALRALVLACGVGSSLWKDSAPRSSPPFPFSPSHRRFIPAIAVFCHPNVSVSVAKDSVSWPHGKLPRTHGPQSLGPRGAAAPFWRTPRTVRGPIGRFAEGSSGRRRMAPPPNSGAPLTRFGAPWGAPPDAPTAGVAWRRRPIRLQPRKVRGP